MVRKQGLALGSETGCALDYDEIHHNLSMVVFTNSENYGYSDAGLGFAAVGLHLLDCDGDLGPQRVLEFSTRGSIQRD